MKKKIEKKKERKKKREKERKTNSHIACVASVSAGVRRECWDESKKAHLERLKAAKQAGKSAYFILDCLIIRDKPSGSSND